MCIIIQLIDIQWTKKSRGMPLAKLRSSISENYSFGSYQLDDEAVYIQNINYYEYHHFEKPIISEPKKINEYQQRQNKLNFLNNGFDVDVLNFGIPLRRDYPKVKNIGSLSNNSWLKIVGNVRVHSEETWQYHKYIFNIFRGNSLSFDEVIASQAPKAVYRNEVDL